MRFGLDFLFAPKYENTAVAGLPADWATGCFWNIAGNSVPFAKKVLDKGCPHFRSAGLWSDAHSYGKSDVPELQKMAHAFQILAVANPQAKIEISCFCEHQLNNPDFYHDIIKNEAPNCFPINTPEPGGAWSTKYKNETHGAGQHQDPTNRSGDGGINNYDDLNIDITTQKQTHSSCEVFFFWTSWCNGKFSMNDNMPRPNRTGWPTLKDIQAMVYLANDRGSVHLDPHWLLKSNSEQHSANDPKGNKLMFIAPVHGDKIILKRDGKVVDILPYFGTYTDGRFRYYSQHQGWQVGANIEVWLNNKQHGLVNCGFRMGN